jgi:Na+/citrate or Na+/malate symporter
MPSGGAIGIELTCGGASVRLIGGGIGSGIFPITSVYESVRSGSGSSIVANAGAIYTAAIAATWAITEKRSVYFPHGPPVGRVLSDPP